MEQNIIDALNVIEGYKRDGKEIPVKNNVYLEIIMETAYKFVQLKRDFDKIYNEQHYHNEGFSRARLMVDKTLEDVLKCG